MPVREDVFICGAQITQKAVKYLIMWFSIVCWERSVDGPVGRSWNIRNSGGNITYSFEKQLSFIDICINLFQEN